MAVIGPNGAGKSTLLRTISGLVAARSGTIRYDGKEIGGLAASEIPRLGLVHVPEARHVFGSLTVEQNLIVGASAASNTKDRKDALSDAEPEGPRTCRRALRRSAADAGDRARLWPGPA